METTENLAGEPRATFSRGVSEMKLESGSRGGVGGGGGGRATNTAKKATITILTAIVTLSIALALLLAPRQRLLRDECSSCINRQPLLYSGAFSAMDSRREFYVYAISKSSLQLYPGNAPGHFRMQLPQTRSLRGLWMVALKEFLYTRSWLNVRPSFNRFFLFKHDDVAMAIRIPPGFYKDPSEVFEAMQTEITKDWRYSEEDRQMLSEVLILRHVCETGQITMKLTGEQYQINIPEDSDIIQALGLPAKKGGYTVNRDSAEYLPSKKNSCLDIGELMYIYTDAATPQSVGRKEAPLLRIVAAEGEHGSVIQKSFSVPHYIEAVQNSNLSSIEVKICDENGSVIEFDPSASTILVLHFVPVNDNDGDIKVTPQRV